MFPGKTLVFFLLMLPFPLPLLLSFLLPFPPLFSLPTWVYCVGQTDFELPSPFQPLDYLGLKEQAIMPGSS